MFETFRKSAAKVSCAMGSPWAFAIALVIVLTWAIAGPFVHYSEDWQLVINTGTTIATFLMLFLLQNSQNRDTRAINIKLDELLRAIETARTGLANVNELSDEALEKLEGELHSLAAEPPRSANADRHDESAPAQARVAGAVKASSGARADRAAALP